MAKNRIKRQVLINGNLQWITGATEQDYANNLMKAMGIKDYVPRVQTKHDFCEYAWEFYEVVKKPNIDTVTQKTYERQLKLYICPTLQGKYVEDLEAEDIMRVFNAADKPGKKAAKSTKDKIRTVLNPILKRAVEKGLLPKNPMDSSCVRIKGEPSTPTEPYSVEQMVELANNISKVKNPFDRNYLALHALHPFRPEEVLGLRCRDIDLDSNEIHICATVVHPDRNQPEFKEKTKTDKSRRTLALVEEIKSFLTLGNPNDFVVGGGTPLSYQKVVGMCKRIRKDIGFEDKITPQRFRTTVLTDIYEQDKDLKEVQAAAGWTTVAMGMKYYIKGRGTPDRAAKAVANAYGLAT